MTTLTIDNKSYVVVPRKEYELLVTKAASKNSPAKKLSLEQGRKYAYKLIDKWAKRKVTILDAAVESVAKISLFIEGEGLPETAKRFVDDAFAFFDKLSDEHLLHRPCRHVPWQKLMYRCATFRKKYTVAYLKLSSEIVICEFVLAKLLV